MGTIKAVVYHGPLDVRCQSVPMPGCDVEEIRVQVDACAVCGSDIRIFHYGNDRVKPPSVIGHEIAGLIVKAGRGVTKV